MGSAGVKNPIVPMPRHVYQGRGGACGAGWYGHRCDAEQVEIIHWMVCTFCGFEIHPRRVNTLESKPGFYHPGCAGKAATFAEERRAIDVGSNWIGRLADAKAGEALLRDLGKIQD